MAHPRPCGEHKLVKSEKTYAKWLIPARAGSTPRDGVCHRYVGAHPRPCGEHCLLGGLPIRRWGSSPPVRGALHDIFCYCLEKGLIPARAGSTVSVEDSDSSPGAHPRPCGEHSTLARRPSTSMGSSPPVRGAPAVHDPAFRREGLIPARAGSTIANELTQVTTGAHPRPCGEHADALARRLPHLGSSPPVRGALRGDV